MSTSARMRVVSRARTGALPTLLPAIAIALVLSGCRDHHRLDNVTASTLSNPETRHPIGFTPRTEALYVELAPADEGLSGNQQIDVLRFVERYKVEGTGRLTIAAPGSARGHLAASRSVRQVVEIARGAGLPPDAIAEDRQRRGADRHGAAVRLAYERPVAIAPLCGEWPEDLGETRERLPHANFGCATQRNLAMTVATARDLQMPQEEAQGAGERRTSLWTKYVGSSSGAGGGSGGPAAPAPLSPASPKPAGP